MKRKILSLILIFAMLVSLSACQGNNNTPGKGNEKSTVRIASMKGPTSIGLVKLYDDASNERPPMTMITRYAEQPMKSQPDLLRGNLMLPAFLPILQVSYTIKQRAE